MKYILEIDDAKEGVNGAVIEIIFEGDGSYGSVSLPKKRLTPYLADAVYQEGASHGERLGRQEAQEVYRRMTAMFDKSYGDYLKLFDVKPPMHVIRDYTVDELEQMLDEYEKRIRVGDVVSLPSGSKAVVVNVHVEDVGIMYSDGSTGIYDPKYIIKTGEHINSVEETLKKLKG